MTYQNEYSVSTHDTKTSIGQEMEYLCTEYYDEMTPDEFIDYMDVSCYLMSGSRFDGYMQVRYHDGSEATFYDKHSRWAEPKDAWRYNI